MKRTTWKKRLTGLILSLAVFATAMGGAATKADAAPAADLQLAAKSAILLEASTGKILYSMNPDASLPPASMSKMMAEYLVQEAIKEKKISWDEKVPVSEYAFYVARISDTSGVYLNLGESFTVRELYNAMAVVSANDATVLLAEKIAGSEANFVQMMNKKAAEFGMKNTSFVTSSGLPANELGPYSVKTDQVENLMSARDSAILARNLIRDFPEALEVSKIPRFTFRPGSKNELKMANNNWMLPDLPNYYQGVDGLKTGYTQAAGNCFTGTAVRDNMRLISVVMGTDSKTKRFVETKKLYDYGFSNFKLTKQLDKNASVKGFETAPVKNGVELTVPAVTGSEVNVLTKIGGEAKFTPTVTFQDLNAPIKQGQVIGKLVLKEEGAKDTDYLQPEDAAKAGVDVVASQEVEEASWIRLFFRSIIQFFSNLFSSGTGN
ncbi:MULTISPECIES: D-alanyl-D-alanine carboxypeptidase family protein [Brevibacillus]|jgi:D-alanyl-D-alanine carboxypeptidase (penicillin-binding protein 5/6)|uniref:D-alanyl-D-alanine carboxypeptidase family protein n=1 Tax=Brevibacillus TaxID=55080 RepID=UPI000EDCF84F|nr:MULTISPECIES: D-alanyl-D-alanine carboxypeptidase family protein [Brevibacillus]MDH6353668.1 D-alanyl-D-alanine carboxypeptidase (penicillin-binding protein 5/6) [Brevibacillus sp. 1238]MED1723844.1 D-alanyl-D-alanine carboxypeptidase [Brevibacillus parabrevis]NRQ57193.1 D-alanyl-D-alanine carboxypeptidase [Brevibacillus sp. HD1.4A]UED69174.1 D-alanyl-D-alanine carboxypeptidase [Brevibacillus sp. HD3.3A]WDV95466.1 D-alanyl-D-alanine carboxypeptidase [Brevibacillus parabrevis]